MRPPVAPATPECHSEAVEHLTNTIRAIAIGAETIVSGAATPTRVSLPGGN